MSNFVPSKYQKAIFDWVRGDHKSLVVEALAGSGKTTTGIELLDIIPEDQTVLFVAFNRHIKEHIEMLVPDKPNITVKTYNGLGDNIVRQHYPYSKLDKFKVYKTYKERYPGEEFLYQPVSKLVSLIKANLCKLDDHAGILEIIYRHCLDTEGSIEEIEKRAVSLIEIMAKNSESYTFDDQCWMPIAFNMPIKPYDFIFVDEAQDTNKAQMELALRSLSPNGRIVAVGDRYQSIYAFRGADAMAMQNIIERLKPDILPLPISYRCPVSHVEQCNQLFPEIEIQHAPNAILGNIVQRMDEKEFYKRIKPNDMVLCRTNAPLIAPAFHLIRSGIKVTIKGTDIGAGLIALVKRSNVGYDNDMETVRSKVVAEGEKEILKLRETRKNSDIPVQILEDKIETILEFSRESRSVSELFDRIKSIFDDNLIPEIVFSSVHKAKGLEANDVFIINRHELMPHPKATDPIDKEQERNIMYVAFTRSKNNLYYVTIKK